MFGDREDILDLGNMLGIEKVWEQEMDVSKKVFGFEDLFMEPEL